MPTSSLPASSSSHFKSMMALIYGSVNTEKLIIGFLKTRDSASYNDMKTASEAHLNEEITVRNDLTPYKIRGFRIQVINVDGITFYDSAAGSNNTFANIDKPASDFLTTGNYLINTNQGNRVYNMAAFLSAKGTSELIQLSSTTNTVQIYNAQRIGSQLEPIANIVYSCDCDTSVILQQ